MKILVTCAHGTGTGPVMKAKVEQVLQEYRIPFETIHHCAISEAKTLARDYDIIFCATSFASIFKNAADAGTTVIGMRNILSLEEIRLRLHDDPERAASAHHAAVHALLADKLQSKIKYLRKNLPGYTQMALHYRKIGSDSTLADDIIARLLEHVCLQDSIPRTRAAWDKALTRGEQELIPAASELAAKLTRILAAYSDAKQQLQQLKQPAIRADIEAHLARLIYPEFIRASDSRDLDLIDRALAATLKRIEKARLDPLKDLQRQQDLAPWETTLQQALAKHGMSRASDNPPRGTPAATRTALLDYWRLVEAWRIQTYAQELGSPLKASPKRLQEAAEKL